MEWRAAARQRGGMDRGGKARDRRADGGHAKYDSESEEIWDLRDDIAAKSWKMQEN